MPKRKSERKKLAVKGGLTSTASRSRASEVEAGPSLEVQGLSEGLPHQGASTWRSWQRAGGMPMWKEERES